MTIQMQRNVELEAKVAVSAGRKGGAIVRRSRNRFSIYRYSDGVRCLGPASLTQLAATLKGMPHKVPGLKCTATLDSL